MGKVKGKKGKLKVKVGYRLKRLSYNLKKLYGNVEFFVSHTLGCPLPLPMAQPR